MRPAALVLLASTLAVAHRPFVGPFRLRMEGNAAGYLSHCAGPRGELAICDVGSRADARNGYFFFGSFNSNNQSDLSRGLMTFNPNLPGDDWDWSDPSDPDAQGWLKNSNMLRLRFNTAGNVAVAGLDSMQWIVDDVGFDDRGRLGMHGLDDSRFSADMNPTLIPKNLVPRQSWHLCYTIMPGGWDGYAALLGSGEVRWILTWVTGGEPTNPTCKKIDVVMEAVNVVGFTEGEPPYQQAVH